MYFIDCISNASSTDKRRVNKLDYEQYLEDGYYKCPNENCDRKYVMFGEGGACLWRLASSEIFLIFQQRI